jgi:glucuronate isomerase
MKKFMDEHFMLGNKTAQTLYHDYAASQPIFDYQCHLIPRDRHGQALYDDHRRMAGRRPLQVEDDARHGVPEQLVTGKDAIRTRSSTPGPAQWSNWSATRCSTGPIWS